MKAGWSLDVHALTKRTSLLALALACLIAIGRATGANNVQQPTTVFATPHGTIVCTYTVAPAGGATLRCDRLGGLRPAPAQRRCTATVVPPSPWSGWQGLAMTRTGEARPVCSSESLWGKYGGPGICPTSRCADEIVDSWSSRGFRCTASAGDYPLQEAIRCSNRRHHGFLLSWQGWTIH
jgi:hypothetical protein